MFQYITPLRFSGVIFHINQARYTHDCVLLSTTAASGYIQECHPLEKAKIWVRFKGEEKGRKLN
jgi:hypothetical protein